MTYEITHQLGAVLAPPVVPPSAYSVDFTDAQGIAWRLKVTYQPYGATSEPSYSFWTATPGVSRGFVSGSLPAMLYLFVDDVQMWLAGALDKIGQMEAARVAATEPLF